MMLKLRLFALLTVIASMHCVVAEFHSWLCKASQWTSGIRVAMSEGRVPGCTLVDKIKRTVSCFG